MKRLLTVAIFSLIMLSVTAQEQYSRVKIYADKDQVRELLSKGVPLDHGVFKAGVYVISELSAKELAIVKNQGIRYEVLIDDVTKYYAERSAPYLSDLEAVKEMKYVLSRDWPVPEGFELGTCGGFLTIDQMLEHLDNMRTLYPDHISPKYTMNYPTQNGQELYWVRISDNPTVNEDEPEVLYTGMHHAREAIGMQSLIYFMYYLLENYDTDPDVQYIVDNFELYIVPVMNMDGYAYNIQTDPSGGGMWRKNRRPNDDGSYGVDINRNYGYQWGYDDSGSSPIPSDETYRGPSAFSEPEIQNIRDFCNEHDFVTALNYHSYSGLLLYAWGWSADPCNDDAIFHAHGGILTKENGYTYGPSYTTIYPTNGGSDDWMYGEQDSKNLIFAYTPEVGSGDDGFWPVVSNIIPLCQITMWQDFMIAKLAGPWAEVHDLSPSIIENQTGMFFFDIQRLGLKDGAAYTVSIEPLSDAIASIGDPHIYDNLNILETANGAFSYTLKEGIQSGDMVDFLLSVNNGYTTFSDTIHKVYGTANIIFADSADNFNNWTSNKWNTTTQQYHSAPRSIADSPTGQYGNGENNILTLNDPIDLSNVVYASLSYWARWDVEAGYDYVQVLISDDNGSNWTPMQGLYTHAGNSNQAAGEPLYDGTNTTWVKEDISLAPYLDKQIKIRFVLKSDDYVVGDGFYWDDMTVTVVDVATGIDSPISGSESMVSISPNPANETATVTYALDKQSSGSIIKIYNNAGQEVYQSSLENNSGELKIDIATWKPGLYFYNVANCKSADTSGKFIVK